MRLKRASRRLAILRFPARIWNTFNPPHPPLSVRIPARIWNTYTSRLAHCPLLIRFPAQVWNAHTPKSLQPPLMLKVPAHIWNAFTQLPTGHAPPQAGTAQRRGHCGFRPGRGVFAFYRVNRNTVTYRPACMRDRCRDCRRWYPRLTRAPGV